MNDILFIEDNRTKAEDICNFLSESFSVHINLKNSYITGLREIITTDYDLLLLDMSLPTRDRSMKTNNEEYENLGGYNIMKEMKRKKRNTPTILITMFREFGIGESFLNTAELDNICKLEFGDFYMGFVFYSSKENKWKTDLRSIINTLDENITNR